MNRTKDVNKKQKLHLYGDNFVFNRRKKKSNAKLNRLQTKCLNQYLFKY